MPCPSLLDTQPPEGGEGPILPLKALSERFEVSFAEFGILRVFMRIGQRHEDHPPLERPEGSPVNASETEQEVCAACPGETPYLISGASSETLTRPEPVLGSGVLEGECGYRPSYSRGDVGNPLMWTLQRRLIAVS